MCQRRTLEPELWSQTSDTSLHTVRPGLGLFISHAGTKIQLCEHCRGKSVLPEPRAATVTMLSLLAVFQQVYSSCIYEAWRNIKSGDAKAIVHVPFLRTLW